MSPIFFLFCTSLLLPLFGWPFLLARGFSPLLALLFLVGLLFCLLGGAWGLRSCWLSFRLRVPVGVSWAAGLPLWFPGWAFRLLARAFPSALSCRRLSAVGRGRVGLLLALVFFFLFFLGLALPALASPASGLVGVVGSRSLPASAFPLVARVVASLLARGFGLASGGALGADLACLSAVVAAGAAACSRSVVFSAFSSLLGLPVAVRPMASRFRSAGGSVLPGLAGPGSARSAVVSALFGRSSLLVSRCSALVVFFHRSVSAGSLFTLRAAVARGLPVVVFLSGGAVLPALSGGRWVAVPVSSSRSCWAGAFRWSPQPPSPALSGSVAATVSRQGGCGVDKRIERRKQKIKKECAAIAAQAKACGKYSIIPAGQGEDQEDPFLEFRSQLRRLGFSNVDFTEKEEIKLELEAIERRIGTAKTYAIRNTENPEEGRMEKADEERLEAMGLNEGEKTDYSVSRKIFTIGYGNRNPVQFFDLLKNHREAKVIDVRAFPVAHRKEFSRLNLQKSPRYQWIPELGNLTKSIENIRLKDEPVGMAQLAQIIDTNDVILLCAEMSAAKCHRSYVARQLQAIRPETQIINL